MKKQTRRQFTPDFKAKVALEAIKGQYTLVELAKKFEVNQGYLINPYYKLLVKDLSQCFLVPPWLVCLS